MIKGSGTSLFSDVEFLYASYLYVRVLADYMPCTLILYVLMMQLPVIKSQMDRVPAELLRCALAKWLLEHSYVESTIHAVRFLSFVIFSSIWEGS